MAFNSSPFESQPTTDLDQKIFPSDIYDDSLESDHLTIDTGLLSPTNTDRKNSFATPASSIFSPQSTGTNWDEFPVPNTTALPERHMSMASHYSSDTPMSNNPFHAHNMQWFKPQIAPQSTYDAYADNYNTPTSLAPFPPLANFGGHIPADNVRPAAIMPPAPGTTVQSPMALVEQEMESQRMNKRMRPSSPHRMGDTFRRDGVRKKNARFEIPMERNLQNIDELIANCSNDEDLKELKQQKRLLRNRQAALDSRQRKKKHTEDLEEEKKIWSDRHSGIENELKELQMRFDQVCLDNQSLRNVAGELQVQVQTLQGEKEDLVTEHTLETANLRKKISVLMDQMDSSPPAQSTHPADYTDFARELDALNMGGDSDWSAWVTDFADIEPQQNISPKSNNTESTLVVGQRRKDTLMSEASDKQMVNGSFLLLFLLYGAFVATRSTASAAMPPVSPEFREGAEAILNHVLADDSGVQQSNMAGMLQQVPQMAWATPSHTRTAQQSSFSPPANSGSLGSLTHRILTPSKQQEAEAAFSMTPAQYNSMTSEYTRRNYESSEGEAPRKGPLKLADMVRANREATQQGGQTVAEVYTRSLMWDRIPTEVVQEFKRMVSSCGNDGDETNE